MALLLDTQILVWIGGGDRRLPRRVREAIEDIANPLFVSAVIAFEFADLHQRGRFGRVEGLEPLLETLGAVVLPLPADAWLLAQGLPDHHRDPIDRMLIAHAIHSNLTLVTADEAIRNYPVRSLW